MLGDAGTEMDHGDTDYSPMGGSGDEEKSDDEDIDGFIINEDTEKSAPDGGDVVPDFRCGECNGERVPKTLRSPIKPSAEAIAAHYTTHLPYRNWCPVCVKAKGKEDAHRRGANVPDKEDEAGVATVSMDYNSLDESMTRVDEHLSKLKTMVMKDEVTGNVFQHRVEVKGPSDEWLMKKLCKDMEELGRRDAILKTDGEPAMVAVQTKVQGMRAGRTLPKNPPAYNPESNGPIEKAVQDVTGQTRAIKIGLESRIKVEIKESAAIIDWILEHAAFLICKYSVGHDGMTPHERLTGTKWRRPAVEIGEVVLAKLVGKKRKKGKKEKQKKKLAEQSVEAVWVGQVARTGEHIVVQPGGDAFRCRTVRRVPEEDRWCAEKILQIIATPRKPTTSRGRRASLEPKLADEHAREAPRQPREPAPRQAAAPESGADLPPPEARPPRQDDVRRFPITNRILDKYGYSDDCRGCKAKIEGRSHWEAGGRQHSAQCRRRIFDAMALDEDDKLITKEDEEKMERKRRRREEVPDEALLGEKDKPAEEVRQSSAEASASSAAATASQAAEHQPPAPAPGTPRFGQRDDDGNIDDDDDPDDEDELMELTEDRVQRSKDATKRAPDRESEDEDEPNPKRQKLKPLTEHRLVVTTEDERGVVLHRHVHGGRPHNGRTGAQDGPLIRRTKIQTAVALAMYASKEPEKDAEEIIKRHEEHMIREKLQELIDCHAVLNTLRQHTEVKRIIQDIDKNIKCPARAKAAATLNNSGKVDVAEVYSPPRIAEVARSMGLRPGWSLDLTEIDPDDNEPWDLSRKAKQDKAKAKVNEDKPLLLVLCPMCGPFSTTQNLNYINMEEREIKDKLEQALEHVRFSVELCKMQRTAGRLFVFEHPAGASSWESKLLKELHAQEGVMKVNFDFCMAGMMTGDRPGDGKRLYPVKKRTSLLTNSHAIFTIFREVQCHGEHKHREILSRTSECQKYPEKFSKLICEGVRRELDTIAWRNRLCKTYDVTQSIAKLMKVHEKLENMESPPEEDPFAQLYDGLEFVDDISGSSLIKELAVEARKKEIEFFKQMGVYTKIKKERWMKIISTKWIDQNKGDFLNPDYRSRLVGREIKRDRRGDLFAATPPLESLKLILSRCASRQYARDPAANYRIMYNDVKRAYFHAPAKRPVYIKIPDEDFEPGDEDRVGVLNLSLYGTRDAAMNWAAKYTEVLQNIGFTVGLASPCNFYHEGRDISTTVHGDDFTSTGTARNLQWMDMKLREEFDMKTEVFGPDPGQQRQARILNRVISWEDDGIHYEADQRHAEIIISELGLKNAKSLATPGSREDATKAGPPTSNKATTTVTNYDQQTQRYTHVTHEHDDENGHDQLHEVLKDDLLNAQDARAFRGLTARLNYLAQDRPDLQFAAKEVSRRMARPSDKDWALLKHVGRYLVGAPRAVQKFEWQVQPEAYDTFVDSDWAGCSSTCRSTSGGAVRLGWHTVRTWSSTQATVAMSSAEAELFSLTKGTATTLGLMSVARDLGMQLNATVHSDASAALAIAQRQGLGKLRHLKVQYLWVQEKVRKGDIGIRKVDGKENPSDLMTKHLNFWDLTKHLEALGVSTSTSRAAIAPRLAGDGGQKKEEDESEWHFEEDGQAVRYHAKPRTCLFTPARVRGAPPVRALTAARITRGSFCDNGETFTRCDNWTSRATAHLSLRRHWVGTTTFLLRTHADDPRDPTAGR